MHSINVTDAVIIATVLRALKESSSLNVKRDIVKRSCTSAIWAEFLDMVGNPDRQFYVAWKSVLAHKKFTKQADFYPTFNGAQTRTLTPNQTRSLIRGLLKKGYPADFLRAICDKTLDCGITVAQIYKCLGVSESFRVALASDALDMTDDKLKTLLRDNEYISTPKMDGLRCFIVLIPGMEGAYSRSGKPLMHLEEHINMLRPNFAGCPGVLDGEILADDWNGTVTAVRNTKKGKSVAKVFHVFDFIPADEFMSCNFVMPYRERLKIIQAALPCDPKFDRVVGSPVKSISAAFKIRDQHIAAGYEGSVLHNLDGIYTPGPKRSTNWIKIKEMFSGELKVTGFIEGTGKHKGRLGAITVSGKLKHKNKTISVTTKVGTGFSDADRIKIWKNQKKWKGALVEIGYQEITKDNSLRFPTFLRRRTDVEKGL